MENLSLKKRERLLEHLSVLRKECNTSDELLRALGEIENELLNKKFGLVWEEHEEAVDVKMRTHVPVFAEVADRELCTNVEFPYNFILEGDNLHSLYLLDKTCHESVDCIYIDPPYNTGAKDWKYNNNYVDKTNRFRHSKWLSMMNARLQIAKGLLKDDGVLICAIDENELATVILLLDDIFGPAYAKDPITIVHNPRGVQGDNFSYVNEYAIFVYRRGSKIIEDQAILEGEIDWSPLRNWGSESERQDAANCFYPIFVKDGAIVGFGDDVTDDDSIHPKQTEYNELTGIYSIYPIDVQGVERKWRYARQSVESIRHLLRVKEIEDGFDVEIGKDFIPYKTVWTDKKFDANEYGTQLIKSMVPHTDFSFPKSIYNTYECLRAVTLNRPNALIVDFFAGSGTTGHATLLLNKEDGGNRRFILCTNNDVGAKREAEFKKKFGKIDVDSDEWKDWCEKYGIASSVTYPRIKAAIQGFVHKKDFKDVLYQRKITPSAIKNSNKIMAAAEKCISENRSSYDDVVMVVEDSVFKVLGIKKKGEHIDGIPSNLKYYRTDFVDKQEEFLSDALIDHIKEMIQIEHGVSVDGKSYVLVLDDDNADKLEEQWLNYSALKGIFVSRNVLLTSSQDVLFNSVSLRVIPDCYFDFELKEVGESW